MLDISKLLNSCWSGKTAGWKLKIISDWPIIMGSLHEHARVEKVYDDAILLGVYDTCWMQELHLLSNMIIKKINNHLAHPYITQIRLKYVQKHEFRPNKLIASSADHKIMHNLSNKEQAALKNITDPELRNAMQDFLNRCQP